MDSISRLETLSGAVYRYEQLKNENRRLRKRCERLEGLALVWKLYSDRLECQIEAYETTNSEVREKSGPGLSLNGLLEQGRKDKEPGRELTNSSGTKLNKFSKKIKRILSNKPGDENTIKDVQNDKRTIPKVSEDLIPRSKSEDDNSESHSFSPSFFLVSEVSKQVCGHHGLKLDNIDFKGTDNQKVLQGRRSRGRKSSSLSIDSQHIKLMRSSRRASCDVVPWSANSGCASPSKMILQSFNLWKTLDANKVDESRCSESPVFDDEIENVPSKSPKLSFPCEIPPSATLFTYRRLSPLSTLHEEIVLSPTRFENNTNNAQTGTSKNILLFGGDSNPTFAEKLFQNLSNEAGVTKSSRRSSKIDEVPTSDYTRSGQDAWKPYQSEARDKISGNVSSCSTEASSRVNQFMNSSNKERLSDQSHSPTSGKKGKGPKDNIVSGSNKSCGTVQHRKLSLKESCKEIKSGNDKEIQRRNCEFQLVKEAKDFKNPGATFYDEGKFNMFPVASLATEKHGPNLIFDGCHTNSANRKQMEILFRKDFEEDFRVFTSDPIPQASKDSKGINEREETKNLGQLYNDSEVAKLNHQINILREEMEIMRYKNIFLNALLDSRWQENLLSEKFNTTSPLLLREVRCMQTAFKSQIETLLEEIILTKDRVATEDDFNRPDAFKDFEELVFVCSRDETIPKTLFVFCISKLLQLFHKQFVQMKNCLHKKDTITQCLENCLLVERVTNKLMQYKKTKRMAGGSKIKWDSTNFNNIDEETPNSHRVSRNYWEEIRDFQQEKEYECIQGAEVLEAKVQEILTKATKNHSCVHLKRQLAQEFDVSESETSNRVQFNEESYSNNFEKEPARHKIGIDKSTEMSKAEEFQDGKRCQNLNNLNKNASSKVLPSPVRQRHSLKEKQAIHHQLRSTKSDETNRLTDNRDVFLEFSLNDLITGGQKACSEKNFLMGDTAILESHPTERKYSFQEAWYSKEEEKGIQINDGNIPTSSKEAPGTTFSIFRPSTKKSDWVFREAKLPYFEIKSIWKENVPTISVTDDTSISDVLYDEVAATTPTEPRDEEKCSRSDNCNPHSTERNVHCPPVPIPHRANRSNSIDAYHERNTKSVTHQQDEKRCEKNTIDKWNSGDAPPRPASETRSVPNIDSTRRNSKSLLQKISPNKSPLNICKNLCLVNGQSLSVDDDKPEMPSSGQTDPCTRP